jgi:hypothetical protein
MEDAELSAAEMRRLELAVKLAREQLKAGMAIIDDEGLSKDLLGPVLHAIVMNDHANRTTPSNKA